MTTTEMNTKPKRRWFQYSLRTMLIVMLLAGSGMGWPAVHNHGSRITRTELACRERSASSEYRSLN
jgi:hypothetical protein